MAVYNCECGLIISTSSERPRCLRCLRVLGPLHLAVRTMQPLPAESVVTTVIPGRRRHFRQVTMGYRLNERSVLPPIVWPK